AQKWRINDPKIKILLDSSKKFCIVTPQHELNRPYTSSSRPEIPKVICRHSRLAEIKKAITIGELA
ncbi:hypothetical protein, partial [Mesorhizobium sanjuanii]|uniref:hypothetical protein n=1 Tax=Mesorhizobium sanjuanii TaxID=2037900 RepID=UPI001AD7E6E0